MIFLHARRRGPVRGRSGVRALPVAAIILCGFPQTLHALPQASNPDAPAPRTKYRPIIENYVPFRPVEPRSWSGVNEEVAPKPKPKPQGEQKR